MVAKNKSKNKGKSVDEEASLKVIENTEFVAMRKMQRQLPKPSTSEAELDLLVAHGLLQEKCLSNFSGPGEHDVPSPTPNQSVLFVPFVRAGLCYPPSDFLLEFLGSYGIQIHHLTPNGVLFLSTFVHFCEVFVGIPPNLLLFRHFFRVRLSDGNNTPFLGYCLIQSRQGVSFPSLTLSDSVKNWAEKWFYISKPALSFSHDLSVLPVPLSIWKDKISSAERAALKPVLARVAVLK